MTGSTVSELRPITEDEVRRYLVAKGTTDKCFSCGHDGWYMDGGSQNLYRCIPWGVPKDSGPASVVQAIPSSIAVVTMTCKNCGFVRMHDVYMILVWLKLHPEEMA